MYEFIDRLVTVALPRIRDFRGLNPNSFDGRGNYTLGVKEHIIFPEIDFDKILKRLRAVKEEVTSFAEKNKGKFTIFILNTSCFF